MKPFLILYLFCCSTSIFGQAQCVCDKDSSIKESISCDTTILKNKSLLYYQFNCDTIWLTLESSNKKRMVLFSMGTELSGYNYRLGFQLVKEFKNSLLFRYGCPANGPCDYVLVNKFNGQQEKQLYELVYTSEDKPTNFIIYFADTSLNRLTLYNVDSKKKHTIKVPGKRFKHSPVPEQQFEGSELKKNILILKYHYPTENKEENQKIDTVIIDLKKYAS
ncbi:MAG TPA: hypothetical protein VIZ28_18430 [Chitinophagaceae bacterium]